MRFFLYLLMVLLVASNASAECRDKECMPNQYTAEWENSTDWTFHYDSVFTIGDNWFIIFEREGPSNPDTITFEFAKGPSKITDFDNNVINGNPADNGSISFSGSSFVEESFHNVFYINFTRNGESGEIFSSYELEIQINKPPADDLVYLWGGMTIFWLSIGLYVLYISNKFRELSDKIGVENNGAREKN